MIFLKKNTVNCRIAFLLIISLFYSCNKDISSLKLTEDKSTFIAKNIRIKSVKKAYDGVTLFYDSIKQVNFSNALALMPAESKNIEVIYKALSEKNISFQYNLDRLEIKRENQDIILVANNEKGNNFIKNYKGEGKIIEMIQLAYFQKQKLNDAYIKPDKELSTNEMLMLAAASAEEVLKTDVDDHDGATVSKSNCLSGGPGATSCSHTISGGAGGGSVSFSCSVTCGAGYYACCGLKCSCVKNGS